MKNLLRLILPALVALLTTAFPGAVKGDLCGDFNLDGKIIISDLTLMVDYIPKGWVNLTNHPDSLDWDNHHLITLSDVQYLTNIFFRNPDSIPKVGNCPPAYPPLDPPLDTANRLIIPKASLRIMPNQLAADVSWYLETVDTLQAISVPMRFRLGSEIAFPTTFNAPTSLTPYFNMMVFPRLDQWYDSAVSVQALSISETLPGGLWFLWRFEVTAAAPSSDVRWLEPEWTTLPPAYHDTNGVIPMLIKDGLHPETHTKPGLAVVCCLQHGDFNGDFTLTVSDLTSLVGYLFGGQTNLLVCLDAADANGDSSVTVADLTFMVGFLFRGGPSPAPCPY